MRTKLKISIVSASAYQYLHCYLNSFLFLSVTAQVGFKVEFERKLIIFLSGRDSFNPYVTNGLAHRCHLVICMSSLSLRVFKCDF